MNEYIQIGTIKASHGLKGKVIVQSTFRFTPSLSVEDISPIFLEKNKDSFIPYFVESVSLQTENRLLLQLEDIPSKEAAKSILQQSVYLKKEDFKKILNPDSSQYLIGFTLWDQKEKMLGKVEEVLEYPQQMLAKISHNEKEILIPLNEETIIEVDNQKKMISLDLPEGLLDIYRS